MQGPFLSQCNVPQSRERMLLYPSPAVYGLLHCGTANKADHQEEKSQPRSSTLLLPCNCQVVPIIGMGDCSPTVLYLSDPCERGCGQGFRQELAPGLLQTSPSTEIKKTEGAQ